MPYSVFDKSLQCLDNRRLGKQRVEAKQIYDILTGKTKTKAWKHHPALMMWKGYEKSLALYYNCALYQWEKRGFRNIKLKPINIMVQEINFPPWLGNEELHRSHKSNLLRKNPDYYKDFSYYVTNDLPYVWPTKEGLM